MEKVREDKMNVGKISKALLFTHIDNDQNKINEKKYVFSPLSHSSKN